MAIRFNTGDWADPIAKISTRPEYQNAEVRFEDPSLVIYGDYDPTTETTPIIGGDPLIYEGAARVIPVRWGVDNVGQNQANSSTVSAIRVQIDRDKLQGRVLKGTKMFVTSCPRTPNLETMVFTCTSDVQGSMSASRTFEFAVDGDAVRDA